MTTTGSLVDKLEDVDAQQRAGVAVEPRGKTARDLITEMEPQFRRALPAHVDGGRFTRLALTALRTVPRLAECSGESILAGLMQAAHLGLEIDAFRGQAYLVPRWNNKTRRMEASFQAGYKGLIELAGRGGITIRARAVHDNDLFEYEDGLEPKLRHVPELKKERGDAWAYFAVATFSDGRASEFVVMSKVEVEAHRDRFASARNKQGLIVGPWVDHFDPMALKTLVIKLSNYLPLPVELVDALSMEDVPIDVTPDQAQLPPASPADVNGTAAEQGSGPPPEAAPEESPETSEAPTTPAEGPQDDQERRELAQYLRDEAIKADPDSWKQFKDEHRIPTDSRRWTPAHVEQVIEWITAEPAESTT